MGIEDGEEVQAKGVDNIFNKTAEGWQNSSSGRVPV
jgi:hypothetical protein